MSKVLIIGCGGVASVAIHKCCQVPEVFTDICIASRTKSKCDKLAAELAPKTMTRITTYEYRRVVNRAMDLGLTDGYMQQKSSAREEYTPSFDLTGI